MENFLPRPDRRKTIAIIPQMVTVFFLLLFQELLRTRKGGVVRLPVVCGDFLLFVRFGLFYIHNMKPVEEYILRSFQEGANKAIKVFMDSYVVALRDGVDADSSVQIAAESAREWIKTESKREVATLFKLEAVEQKMLEIPPDGPAILAARKYDFTYSCPVCGDDISVLEDQKECDCPSCHSGAFRINWDAEFVDGMWRDLTSLTRL